MKALIPILICSLLFIGSCKDKEEDNPEPYTPFASKVIGKWKVTSSTDNNTNSTETYPATIEESSLEFKTNSEIQIKIVCNGGIAQQYLVSEAGGIFIDNIFTTSVVCSNATLSNTWRTRIRNTLDNANHVTISGNSMTLYGTDDYNLTLTRE